MVLRVVTFVHAIVSLCCGYNSEALLIQRKAHTTTFTTCCTQCGGKPFCSPDSGNCYYSKNKEYYATCGNTAEGGESGLSDSQFNADSIFKIAKLKPDLECAYGTAEHVPGGGQQAVKDHLFELLREGYGVVGIIQAEYKVGAPSNDEFFFVGSMCKRSWKDYGDPVIIIFKKDLFDFVRSVGFSRLDDWSEMPYVGTGTIDKHSSADACTADPNAHGERGYAGAIVKHKQSQKELCVIVGTLPHGGQWNVRDRFHDELQEAGCHDMPILFALDANWEGDVSHFDRRNAWGSCLDPGRDYVYNNFEHGNKYVGNSEASTCLRQTCPRFDRIALCNSPEGDLGSFFLDDFVCKAEGEHAPSKAHVSLF